MANEHHPVQVSSMGLHAREHRTLTSSITLRAYEVYRHIFGEQTSLITGNCRGGFSMDESVAFLYARSFPRNEWRQRFDEACNGMGWNKL